MSIDKEDVAHIYNEILLRHKKIEIMPFVATWVDLKSVMSEVSQRGEISYDIPYMWNLNRSDTNELTKQKQTHRL